MPEEIVAELDRHVIGQKEAKRAVAIALRNRWRRRHIQNDNLRAEVSPMNILMSGPTGSGKTEIARRLAKMTDSPFLKVEATKYTEVGIYGASAESMIKDLVNVAVDAEREKARKHCSMAARDRALDRLVKSISESSSSLKSRPNLREDIEFGRLDNVMISIQLRNFSSRPKGTRGSMDMMMEMPPEFEQMMKSLNSMMHKHASPSSNEESNPFSKTERLSVKDAFQRLEFEEAENIINEDEVIENAIENVQNNGIIFLDEIDKLAEGSNSSIAGRGGGHYRKGEGVQKELLALTEGCVVSTRQGLIHTDHILFIASGAFHKCNPSDLIPELQGRLPIRVTLSPLGAPEYQRILKDTEYNLLQQTQALLETEGIELLFTDDAIVEMAAITAQINSQTDDIGARRLSTVVAKVTDEISFHASRMDGMTHRIDKAYVRQRLSSVMEKTDLSKYIL
ncbi:unnamed protein product [Albugo candida]|nr:unnamed protein product [Albugo candida]|eukprot:CCI40060.1 unnamed protein product [Albugo candida]